MSLNQILLIGNCGSDPEMRYTPNGAMVVNFSLAVNSYRNGADGEQIQDTEWFRIACWNKTAESVNQFLQKGQRCFVEGRFRSSTYTGNDGTQRQSSEVTAFRVIFLDRSSEASSNETPTNNDQSQSYQNNNETKNTTNNDTNSESDDIEELPW
ncbi:MAG: single-stranded DNA-binding protein [Dehalococcoidales bacterium]|nr:single-stranded DNA-binding protein [Dehalococcoidia bacterium]NCG35406.1 single-stranded DNA-binding protein [Dehalococcoidales bacterium]